MSNRRLQGDVGYRSSGTSNITDVWTTFHFFVTGASGDAITLGIFTEVTGLEVEVEVERVAEGGVNTHWHNLPGRAKVSDITLKNGIMVNNALWAWFKEILQGKYTRKHITITMVSEDGDKFHSWQFANALPVKWTGPQLRTGQTELAIQSLQLTHEGLIIT